ncbi:MAG: DL-endopeptidase inhibitor IseA family protein [Oscillospiraceae bacterium]
MYRIMLSCFICVTTSLACIGCDRISNDDSIQSQEFTQTTLEVTTSQTIEDTQTSSMTISLDTVPLATTVSTPTDTTTTLDTTSISDTTTSTTSTSATTSTTSATSDTPSMLDLVSFTNNSDALPPLNDDLKNLFKDAFYTYYEFTSAGTIQVDASDNIQVDDRYYSKVIDNRFTSIDEVSSYLEQYFTNDFIENSFILNKFVERDGSLYTCIGARSCNISYCGHTFEILDQSDDEISFQALVYFSADGTWTDTSYYINTTPDIEYVTQLSRYLLVNTSSGWRFDTFSPIY